MHDPYDPLSIHDVWPLVADASHPGGIRFAEIGRDAPADCVVSPAALPEATVEIRLFPTPGARDSWCSAVAEFGGNAVHATPLARDEILAALLVRFDRDRPPGPTLETCVALVGALPGHASFARGRARHALQAESSDRAWRSAWATELDATERIAGLRVDEHFHGPSPRRLVLDRRGGGLARAVWIEPVPSGRRITLRTEERKAFDLGDPDLTARMAEAVKALGYALDGDGDPVRDVAAADEPALRAVLEDLAGLERVRAALREASLRRAHLREARDGRPGAILRRMADGFPVAKAPASSGYAYQVNPVSGAAVDVHGYALDALWKAGAVRPAWWSSRLPSPRRDKPFDAFEASLWVANDIGLALLSGTTPLAELAERSHAAVAEAWTSVTGDAPSPSFDEAIATVHPRERWTPATLDHVPRPPAGKRLPKRARDLAHLAGWRVHGRIGGVS